jgi:biopolymer transport protein ExbD
MVDIAFLLLIFYMVTTIFSAPLSMEISLPPKPEPGENPPEVKIGESSLLQIFVDKNDSVYYQIGKDMKQPQMVPITQVEKVIDEKNETVPGLVMVLKVDQAASYKMMVNIIDDIQGVERKINESLTARNSDSTYSVKFSLQDMTAWDEHVLDVVKSGGAVEE